MTKSLLSLALASMLPMAGIADLQAQDNQRVLICTSTYGDYMGTSPADKCTAQKQYYYDSNMRIVAIINTATNANEYDQITQHYLAYRYDAEGKLQAIDAFQYGLYDLGDRSMEPSAGSSTYAYDEQGNLIEEISGGNIVRYEYDADGNVAKESRFIVNSYSGAVKAGKTVLYSDYVAKGKPGRAVSSHSDETLTGEFYEETYTYDDQLRLVETYRECNVDKIVKIGSFTTIELVSGTFLQQERWTYEGDDLMLYEKFNNMDEESGELIPYLKTVYTKKSDNIIGHQSYTAFWMPGAETEWYKTGTYQEDEYADFSEAAELTAFELLSATNCEEGINCVRLAFSAPSVALLNPNTGFNIFRNGEFVHTAYFSEIWEEDGDLQFDVESGNFIYTDRELKNGSYEYFIQCVYAVGDVMEGPLSDELDDDMGVTPLTYVPGCASNIVTVEVNLELPAATGLKAIASVKNSNDDYVVTIQYNAPVNAEAYGFISNSLMVNNMQVSEDVTKDAKQTEMKCTIFVETATVYIVSRYKYGKVLSEKVAIDVNHLSEPTSIAKLQEQMRAGKMVFDMSGRQVNAQSDLKQGNYIVVDGSVARKVTVK